jgi:hypothetical protein
MPGCQLGDPGSIPGRRTYFLPLQGFSFLLQFFLEFIQRYSKIVINIETFLLVPNLVGIEILKSN